MGRFTQLLIRDGRGCEKRRTARADLGQGCFSPSKDTCSSILSYFAELKSPSRWEKLWHVAHKHVDPSPVKPEGWWCWLLLMSLSIHQKNECPLADSALLYYKTCHYLLQVGTHDFEGTNPMCPPLPGKAMKRSFSKWKWKLLSCVQLLVTPWTVACQAPLSMEFPRQEYWCGEPFPSTGDLPNPEIESRSPSLQADSLPSEPPVGPLLLHPKLCLWDLIWHWGTEKLSFQYHSQTYCIFPLVPASYPT